MCDRLDSRPDDSDYMSLLMRATDLSNKLSEARYQISSIMDKMISKSGKGKTINGKSDLSAHDMKLVFEEDDACEGTLVDSRLCNHPVLDPEHVRRIKYTYSTYPDGPGLGYVA